MLYKYLDYVIIKHSSFVLRDQQFMTMMTNGSQFILCEIGSEFIQK